jgi:hypothetical protein
MSYRGELLRVQNLVIPNAEVALVNPGDCSGVFEDYYFLGHDVRNCSMGERPDGYSHNGWRNSAAVYENELKTGVDRIMAQRSRAHRARS